MVTTADITVPIFTKVLGGAARACPEIAAPTLGGATCGVEFFLTSRWKSSPAIDVRVAGRHFRWYPRVAHLASRWGLDSLAGWVASPRLPALDAKSQGFAWAWPTLQRSPQRSTRQGCSSRRASATNASGETVLNSNIS